MGRKIITRAVADSLAPTSETERTVTAILSDERVALDNHLIKTDGIDTSEYNGAVLFAHQQDQPPIARMLSTRKRGTALVGRMQFPDEETYPFADTIYKLIVGRYLNSMSLSWFPTETRPARDRARPDGMDFLRCKILEASVVPVPANPGCLIEARSRGINVQPLHEWAMRALDSRAALKVPRLQIEALYRDTSMSKQYPGAAIAPVDESAAIAARRAHAASLLGSFKSLGEWARAVYIAAADHYIDQRLVRAPTGMGEQDPTTGGFAVPEEYVESLVDSLYSQTQFAHLCDRMTVEDGRPRKRPSIDETSRVDGSRYGGVKTFWSTEAQTISSSFPRLKLTEFSPHSLLGYCVASSELFGDAPEMLGDWLTKAFGSELGFNLEREILGPTIGGVKFGTGAGRPLGFLNSPALISVAAQVGQSAGTIVKENLDKMWSRMPLGCKRNAVWLVNEDASAQFDISSSTSAWTGVYAAPANGERFARLKGAPVIEVEQAPPLGSLGDIVLADLSQYMTIENWSMAISGDVLFLSDQVVFRFKLRVDGKPLWSSPITPYNGTQTRSPFVALAQR